MGLGLIIQHRSDVSPGGVAGMLQNGWPESIGISGRNASEYAGMCITVKELRNVIETLPLFCPPLINFLKFLLPIFSIEVGEGSKKRENSSLGARFAGSDLNFKGSEGGQLTLGSPSRRMETNRGGKIQPMAARKISKRGVKTMSRRLVLEFPEGVQEKDLQDEDVLLKAKEATVMELLRKGKISQGKAAELLDISRHDLFDLMAKYDIPAIEMTREELKRELSKEVFEK